MANNKSLSIEEYSEKVFYCKSCHSLAVFTDDLLANEHWDGSYCVKCRSTDIGECCFGEWLAEEERQEEFRKKIEWSK